MADSNIFVTEEDLRRALPAGLQDMSVVAFECTDSTNARGRLLPDDTDFPALIFANGQTRGRGRLGRSFHSPENGMYMSLVIKPGFSLRRSTLVTVAAAAAVAKAIDDVYGRNVASIKWVNDIYVDGLKVCGILAEAVSEAGSGHAGRMIIGMGINTSTENFPPELAGIAGAVHLDGTCSVQARSSLAASITEYLLEFIEELENDSSPSFMNIYRSKSNLMGKDVFVYKGSYRKDPAAELDGTAALVTGIDDEGGLQVVYENGEGETLTTGEVSVRARHPRSRNNGLHETDKCD